MNFLYVWILKFLSSAGQALVYKGIFRVMAFILNIFWLSRLSLLLPFPHPLLSSLLAMNKSFLIYKSSANTKSFFHFVFLLKQSSVSCWIGRNSHTRKGVKKSTETYLKKFFLSKPRVKKGYTVHIDFLRSDLQVVNSSFLGVQSMVFVKVIQNRVTKTTTKMWNIFITPNSFFMSLCNQPLLSPLSLWQPLMWPIAFAFSIKWYKLQ